MKSAVEIVIVMQIARCVPRVLFKSFISKFPHLLFPRRTAYIASRGNPGAMHLSRTVVQAMTELLARTTVCSCSIDQYTCV